LSVFGLVLVHAPDRSMRQSVFSIGFLRNKWMQYSVIISILGTIFVTHTPGLMTVFNTQYLPGYLWGVLLALSILPFIVDEITKIFYRLTDLGKRPLVALEPEPPVAVEAKETTGRRKSSAGYVEQIDDL